MKKLLSILGLVAVIGVGSFALASEGIVENKRESPKENRTNYEDRVEDRPNYEDRIENRENMRNFHREELDRNLKNGNISQEDAKKWQEHYDYMDEFHNKNGYGTCHSEGNSRNHGGKRGMGKGHRY